MQTETKHNKTNNTNMDQFILSTIGNTISDANADISYFISCSNPENSEKIKYIEVFIPDFADLIEWTVVLAEISVPYSGCKVGDGKLLPKGSILFTLSASASFASTNNRITIRISNLIKKNGVVLPPKTEIGFKLKRIGDKTIEKFPDDYKFSTVLVAEKKPIIHSFKINPSITRESTDVILTYKCENVTSCEVKDQQGRRVDFREHLDKTKPFAFAKKIHLGSKGSFPNPPFFLYAKEGENEAVENTVANITVPSSPNWIVMENFVEEVIPEMNSGNEEKEGAASEYQTYKLLDLVLNEYKDQLWAFMRQQSDTQDDKATVPCLWCSSDGLNWMPYTYSRKEEDSGVIHSVKLAVPEALIHVPCVHFGKEELFFVGGSRVDISICSSSITVLNLRNGSVREIPAPAAMKPRSLHACLIFPDGQDNENIWVIGGVDKNGNGLNDVWRFDGMNWKQVDTGVASFPKRCQFGATVQTDVAGEKSIWIGGGAARFHGSTLNDVWMYKNNKWVQLKDGKGLSFLNYSDEWLSASALCYVRTSKNSLIDEARSDRYILSNSIVGEQKRLECKWVIGKDTSNNYYDWDEIDGIKKPELSVEFSNASNFAMTAVGFNGCIWIVAIAYLSKENLIGSNLYYSCPIP